MLHLDHLTIIAPTLREGVAHVRDALGLDMPFGGRHPEMGTVNHLLRLGDDVFLEIIAVDPQAARPDRPRWFGLDDADRVRRDWDAGRRLRTWVARTSDLGPALDRMAPLLGRPRRVSRGDRVWSFGVRDDGALPLDGLAPCLIDWGARGSPAAAMPDAGARLSAFVVEHPDPAQVERLHRELGLASPIAIRAGPQLRYEAVVATPAGLRTLW
ncbi:riboflavin deaminase [Methylobacterium sp. Leaf399]|uniref:VOC family protein n=1 Tax=Methylobacterium sp. Leaf399 TaxID=1736364 RepID=UPI0006FAD4A5|nr:VOC family protein [Methylobacterium sp. Leaf399]KQT08559.1 riboflavin deaminase [Methylobacterium sp. Leaf399]